MSELTNQPGPSSISEAALRAAEARARPRPPATTSADAHSSRLDVEGAFNPSRADLLPYYRLLDSEVSRAGRTGTRASSLADSRIATVQLLPKVSKPQAVKTLETILTLLNNILAPPNPAQALKFRQLRLSNKLVAREVVSPANGAGRDYLVLCGFRREVREFEEMLVWKQGEGGKQLFRLRCGKKVVEDRIKQAREAEERETRYRESEKEAEAGVSIIDEYCGPSSGASASCDRRVDTPLLMRAARKAKALLGFEDDRLDRAERDERGACGLTSAGPARERVS